MSINCKTFTAHQLITGEKIPSTDWSRQNLFFLNEDRCRSFTMFVPFGPKGFPFKGATTPSKGKPYPATEEPPNI